MSDVAVDVGIVKYIDGDNAWVELVETGACEECSAKFLCKPGKNGSKQLKVWNPEGIAKVGDTVQLEDRQNLMFKVGMLQFGLPLLGFLFGIILSFPFKDEFSFFSGELMMFLAGVIGIIIAGFWGRFLMGKVLIGHSYFFKISQVKHRPK